MIHYVSINQPINNKKIKTYLSKNYGYIGLVSVCFPQLVFENKHAFVEIQVCEIDKTSENPHRVLARINFNESNEYYHNFEVNHIAWKKLDTQGRELNFYFLNEHGENIKFNDNINMTIALLPANTEWIEKYYK